MAGLKQWFSTTAGWILTPIWQRLKTVLVVTTSGIILAYSEEKLGIQLNIYDLHGSPPQQRTIQAKMSVVPWQRMPGLQDEDQSSSY